MEVPCNRCMACRIRKTGEWTTRLLLESFYNKDNCFITLTYEDEYLPKDLSLEKAVFQRFMKRLRYYLTGVSIRHFSVGEYGEENLRPHYHSLIFGWYPDDVYIHHWEFGKPKYSSRVLDKCWPFGINNVGSVTQESIGYVCGYVRKKLYGRMAEKAYGNRLAPFQLQSKYIGLQYLLDNMDKIIKDKGIVLKGKNHGLSRYFWFKLDLTDEERLEYKKANYIERSKKLEKYVLDNGLNNQQLIGRVADDIYQREKNLRSKENLFVKRGKL